MDVASTASVSVGFGVERQDLRYLDLEDVKGSFYARKKVGEVSRVKRIVNDRDT